MDPLGDQLTTRPIQTGWEFIFELYPSWRFGFIDNLHRQFGNWSVWTRTRTRVISPEQLLILRLRSFAWWQQCVDCFVDMLYLPFRSWEKFLFGALTIVLYVELVVGRDVGCWKIWTWRRHVESFTSRFVRLINSNGTKSPFWPLFQLE
jgi:hypothetical protein